MYIDVVINNEYIKKLAAQLGGNQQHAVSELLRVYEGQAEKDALPAGAEQLEEFENYQAKMHDVFMDLIRSRNDAVELARVDFAKQLDTKDEIITELQKNLKDIKSGEEGATEKAEALRKEYDELKEKMQSEIDKLTSDLKESEEQCKELREQLSDMKKELSEAKENEEHHIRQRSNLSRRIRNSRPRMMHTKNFLQRKTGTPDLLNR